MGGLAQLDIHWKTCLSVVSCFFVKLNRIHFLSRSSDEKSTIKKGKNKMISDFKEETKFKYKSICNFDKDEISKLLQFGSGNTGMKLHPFSC